MLYLVVQYLYNYFVDDPTDSDCQCPGFGHSSFAMDLAQALAGLDPALVKTVGAIAQSVALISRALRSGGASTSAAGGGGGSGPGGLATNVFGDVQLGVREMLILVSRF